MNSCACKYVYMHIATYVHMITGYALAQIFKSKFASKDSGCRDFPPRQHELTYRTLALQIKEHRYFVVLQNQS